jgi:hypothetical protein
MKTIKKIFLLLAAISMVSTGALAQQKAGTTSMQFLKVMPCARATALGDAYSVAATGAEALFWNPAGLAWADNQQVSLTYIQWIFDSKLYDMAYAMPLGNFGSIGLQLQYVDYGNFDESIATGTAYYPGQSSPYLTGRTFKPYSYLAGLTYAKKLTEKFSFGVTAKYAYESLYDQSGMAVQTDGNGVPVNSYSVDVNRGVVLFDAGFRYNTGFKTVQIAACTQNFGPDIKYSSDYQATNYPAPLTFRLGIAGDLIGKNSLLMEDANNRLGLMFDLFLTNDADQQEHIGIEYEFANMFSVRAGYKINYTTEGITFGAGVHQTVGGLKLSVDYSYGALDAMISDYAGNVHRISLGVEIQ